MFVKTMVANDISNFNLWHKSTICVKCLLYWPLTLILRDLGLQLSLGDKERAYGIQQMKDVKSVVSLRL